MTTQEIVVATLKDQQALLESLITQLEGRPRFDEVDCQMYEETLREISQNLSRLRKFQKQQLKTHEKAPFLPR